MIDETRDRGPLPFPVPVDVRAVSWLGHLPGDHRPRAVHCIAAPRNGTPLAVTAQALGLRSLDEAVIARPDALTVRIRDEQFETHLLGEQLWSSSRADADCLRAASDRGELLLLMVDGPGRASDNLLRGVPPSDIWAGLVSVQEDVSLPHQGRNAEPSPRLSSTGNSPLATPATKRA